MFVYCSLAFAHLWLYFNRSNTITRTIKVNLKVKICVLSHLLPYELEIWLTLFTLPTPPHSRRDTYVLYVYKEGVRREIFNLGDVKHTNILYRFEMPNIFFIRTHVFLMHSRIAEFRGYNLDFFFWG